MDKIECYCDASFDPATGTAIVGWKIGFDQIQIMKIENTTNTRAEIRGFLSLIDVLIPGKKYVIYTDCKTIIDRLQKKNELIERNFTTKKGKRLSQADLYQQLFMIDFTDIEVKHIAGHVKKSEMNAHNIAFSELDQVLRRELRRQFS
jgi:ribonuclease HI